MASLSVDLSFLVSGAAPVEATAGRASKNARGREAIRMFMVFGPFEGLTEAVPRLARSIGSRLPNPHGVLTHRAPVWGQDLIAALSLLAHH